MADDATVKTQSDENLIARLASQRSRFRDQASTAVKERDTFKAERDRLMTENAELKKTADTSVAVKRVAELEGKLRDLDHRKVFDRTAKAKGATDAALDDLWTLSGYKAEAPEADEAALGTLIDAQKTARPYLFGGTTETPKNGAPPAKPGPGSGQGAGPAAVGTLNTDQQSDVKYMMMNFDRISADARERMNRGEI